MKKGTRLCIGFCIALVMAAASALPRERITSPKEQFGFDIGSDYQLVNYTQMVAYWEKLARESGRMQIVEYGKTAEGRPMLLAVVTAPENQARLARLKEISSKLARAEGLTDAQARALAGEGKAVVWIDGGLHATEVLGAQQLIELVYQMVSMEDPETLRILADDILLASCVNPDGLELVANWYMRRSEPAKRSTSGLPRLYHKYIGHDNNRDFYMSTQPETEAINRIFYHEWYPQIIYNHHQTGPAGTVLFAPPFRDPFNYFFDPLVPLGIDLVGAAMHGRFVAEGKPGATMRSGSGYSTWWNGGLRTTGYFHNMIGILTETIGNPTPVQIPLILRNQLPRGDLPSPVAPQEWHFRQSVEYSITADRAILDVASKHREDFLMNIYRMGRNAIERGSRDSWTVRPGVIAGIEAAVNEMRQDREAGEPEKGSGALRSRYSGLPRDDFKLLRKPEQRDPRGYIIPSDQADFLTATKFVNTLVKTGIDIHRATGPFEVGGRKYPAGSYVVKTAQAFRPHVLDMFEPQDHPDDLTYPGGPPRPPYDSAGWTLAFQMGVRFDRILDGFDGPFERVAGFAKAPAGRVRNEQGAAGFLLSHRVNDAFVAVNRLLASQEEVYWLKTAWRANRKEHPAGSMFIPAGSSTAAKLHKLAAEIGLNFEGVAEKPPGEAFRLRPLRIGLWDRYGGSISSGWVRWLLEQFEFPFEVVYPPTLDEGGLSAKFDVLIFVDGAIPSGGRSERGGVSRGSAAGGSEDEAIPEEYRGRIGSVTAEKTVPRLMEFMQQGGTLLAIGSSTGMGSLAGLPVSDALTEMTPDGEQEPLPREKFYIPGSLLRLRVDPANPLAYGMDEYADVFFNRSPVFHLGPESASKGVRAVAWFDSKRPLRSGWALGQAYLLNGVAVVEAAVKKGKLMLFGPEIAFRAQPHGTFKFLFNGIYYGPAVTVAAAEARR